MRNKHLNTIGQKPLVSEVAKAELIPNLADGTLWTKDENGLIIGLGFAGSGVQDSNTVRFHAIGDLVSNTVQNAIAEVNTKYLNSVPSIQEEGIGSPVTNILSLTQAEYDGITPSATTFYIITG